MRAQSRFRCAVVLRLLALHYETGQDALSLRLAKDNFGEVGDIFPRARIALAEALKDDPKNTIFLKEKENLKRALKRQPPVKNEIPWTKWLEALDYVAE